MKYLLFTTPMCPNCPSVKEFMKSIDMEGDLVDASTDDGLKKAAEFGVSTVPTVLFLDESGNVEKEAHSVAEIKNILDDS